MEDNKKEEIEKRQKEFERERREREISALREKVRRLNGQIPTIENRKRMLDGKLTYQRSMAVNSSSDLEQLDADIARTEQEIVDIKKRAEMDIRGKETEIRQYKSRRDSQRDKSREKSRDQLDIEREIQKVDDDMDRLKSEISNIERQISDLEREQK